MRGFCIHLRKNYVSDIGFLIVRQRTKRNHRQKGTKNQIAEEREVQKQDLKQIQANLNCERAELKKQERESEKHSREKGRGE